MRYFRLMSIWWSIMKYSNKQVSFPALFVS